MINIWNSLLEMPPGVFIFIIIAMGVTMVGIHERTGRSKISSSQIAHILNDETQRKYIQAIKRLITVSQKSYPSIDRSKMVDFRTEYAW